MREFGFTIPGRHVLVDDMRVRAVAKSSSLGAATSMGQETFLIDGESYMSDHHALAARSDVALPEPLRLVAVMFDSGMHRSPVFNVDDLPVMRPVSGPALLLQHTSTIVVEPECSAHVLPDGMVVLAVSAPSQTAKSTPEATASDASIAVPLTQPAQPVDLIQLSIFGHRFMSIAEQMGRALQRTAISTNIKVQPCGSGVAWQTVAF